MSKEKITKKAEETSQDSSNTASNSNKENKQEEVPQYKANTTNADSTQNNINNSAKETSTSNYRSSSILRKILRERGPENKAESEPQVEKGDSVKLKLAAAEEKIIALEKEKNDFKSKLLYLLAEQENVKKQNEKEIENVKSYGISSLVKEILNITENLERTIKMIDKNALAEDKNLKALHEGVVMTLAEMFNLLKRNGIAKIEAEGKLFDHNYHQAIKTIKDENLENNVIKEVLQDGFTIKDRLLRPAMVIVVNNSE